MKRLCTLLLSLLMVVSFCCALADDVYSEPILFRGASWGTTCREVLKKLPEGVKMRDLKTMEYWYPMSDMMYDESGWGNQLKAEIGCYCYATSSSLKGVKVAGYDVESIYLYFIFTQDKNGKLAQLYLRTQILL